MSFLLCVNRRPKLTCIYKNYNETRVSSNSTLRPQNDTDMECYSSDALQPILIIFGRNVAEKVSYKRDVLFLTPSH